VDKEAWQMTVNELAETLKQCNGDKEVLIIKINNHEIEIHHIKGVAVADTGEALISIGVKND
jgi:hypothetical protein